MRSYRVNYVVVGAFVVAMVVGLVMSLALLTGRTGAVDPYHLIFRNVEGVKFGTQVVYEGYPIGQVEEITPMPEGARMRFRVDVGVREGWRIPADSTAIIAAPGLLSAVTISIAAGEAEAVLKPGDRIESREGANLFTVVSSVATEIKDIAERDLKPLLRTLNTTVGTFGEILDNEGQVLLKNMSRLAADLSERIPGIVDDVELVTAQMKRTTEQMEALFSGGNRERIETVIGSAQEASENFRVLSVELRETRKKTDQLLAGIDSMVSDNRLHVDKSVADLRHVVDSMARHIDSLNQNLEGAARNMYEFSRQIRKNPGLLLGGTPPTETGTAGP